VIVYAQALAADVLAEPANQCANKGRQNDDHDRYQQYVVERRRFRALPPASTGPVDSRAPGRVARS